MHAFVRALIGIGATAAVASAGVAVWNGKDPDNPIANSIQTGRRESIPVKLEPWDEEGPINDRIVLLFASGLNNEETPDGLMSAETVENTFKMSLANWRVIFPRDYKVEFDDRFVAYKIRYDCTKDIVQNGRFWWQAIEAHPELTRRDTKIILVDHSMAVLLGIQYWLLEDRKCVGMLALGGPVGGSPWSDPVELRRCCVAWLGKVEGNKLADLLVSQVNFDTDGMRGLVLGAEPWRGALAAKPLTQNCYFFVGQQAPAKSKVLPLTVIGLEYLWGAASQKDNVQQKAALSYPVLSAVMWAGGYGSNDGMVPDSFITDKSLIGQASVTVFPYETNHNEVANGVGGDMKTDEYKAAALWAISCSVLSGAPESVVEQVDVPDTHIVDDLSGFGPKVDWPVAVWWQEGRRVFVSESGGSRVQELLLRNDGEIDVDAKGTQLAVPTSDGAIVYDLAEGTSRIVSREPATAVVWYGDELIVASKSQLSLVDPNEGGKRVLVSDEALSVHARPVVVGGKIFWANGVQAPFSCYSLRVDDVHAVPINHSEVNKISGSGMARPRRGKGSVLGVYQDGDETRLEWLHVDPAAVEQQALKLLLTNMFTSKVLGEVTDLVAGTDGEVYLVIDGQVRHLDRSVANEKFLEGHILELKEWLKGNRTSHLTIDLDELAPVIGQGDRLGAN